jgi:pyruvate formate lyase activating enzyme
LYCHNPDTWTMSNGYPVTLARATEELRKYRHGLKVMSGGFTLSGGEPLMQDRFAAKLLQAAKSIGIHTALDTNGYLGYRLSDAELDSIDMVLLDITPGIRSVTGGSQAWTSVPCWNLRKRLGSLKKRIWLRFVLARPDGRRAGGRPYPDFAAASGVSAGRHCHSTRWGVSSGLSLGWNTSSASPETPRKQTVERGVPDSADGAFGAWPNTLLL